MHVSRRTGTGTKKGRREGEEAALGRDPGLLETRAINWETGLQIQHVQVTKACSIRKNILGVWTSYRMEQLGSVLFSENTSTNPWLRKPIYQLLLKQAQKFDTRK